MHHHCPSKNQGAGNAGATIAPAALRAMKKARKQVTTGTPPAFPARLVYGL
jgi:hypothetical protein